MPAGAYRSRNRRAHRDLLLLQPGSAAGSRGLPALNERLRQNSLPEKLTRLWIERALRKLEERPALAAE